MTFGKVGKLQKYGFRGSGGGYRVLARKLEEALGVGLPGARVQLGSVNHVACLVNEEVHILGRIIKVCYKLCHI